MALSEKKKKELIAKYGHVPTKKEVFEGLKASQDRLMAALAGALETAPQDPKLRKQLLNTIEKASKLRKGIYKDVVKEKPTELEKVIASTKPRKPIKV